MYFLFQRITFFLLFPLISLSASNNSIYEFLQLSKHPKQTPHQRHQLKLLNTIPPELQNLPYAIYPDNLLYNTARFNFNQRFNVFPKAILNPRTIEEAQYVFGILKRYNLSFSIRSGGHCFEPGSLSSDYIFDLQNFDTIIPNIGTEEVYIGAGCRLNRVIKTLGELNFAIPTGTCPSVGVTGLSLGGGIGLLVRQYGLTCDSIASITLLNAENQVIEVNENSHSDLFWALKGGGNGSYGIVLGFLFKMHYIPKATFYDISWDWKPKHTAKIIDRWQKWVAQLPSNTSSSIRLEYKEGIIRIRIIGIKVGSETFSDWEKPFGKFDPTVAIHSGSYLDTVQYWAAAPSLPFNKSKSKILLEPISKKVIKQIIKYLDFLDKTKPNLRVFLNFDAFGGNLPKYNNSFPFNDCFGWWYFAAYWPYQTQDIKAQRLLDKIYYQVSPEVSKYSYANVPDYTLGKKYLDAYYADNVERLIKIKQKYDPNNIFHWHQSIPIEHEK